MVQNTFAKLDESSEEIFAPIIGAQPFQIDSPQELKTSYKVESRERLKNRQIFGEESPASPPQRFPPNRSPPNRSPPRRPPPQREVSRITTKPIKLT
jgi:hypothetical protein